MNEATDHLSYRTAWREAGDGPPVIFLHGLGGTRKAWGPQLRDLSTEFRCIAWDMPGYGASDPEAPLTYPTIVARLIDLLDHLDLAQVDLVGLSFGGMHAIHTALHHPARVRRMVLLDTSPAFGMNGTKAHDWKQARLAPIAAGQTPGDIGPMVLDAIAGRPLASNIRDELVDAFADIPADGFRDAVECLPHNDVRSELHQITQPSCVLVGEIDEETPVEYARILADGLADATLHVLPGIGHLSPSEAPDLVNDHIRTFLTEDPKATA